MALNIAPKQIINHRFRRGRSGKKDRLDKDAARAAELGMSYGQYKAAEREGRLPTHVPADKAQDDQEEPVEDDDQEPAPDPGRDPSQPSGERKRPCAVCGKMFAPLPSGKYCSAPCRQVGKRENHRAYRQRHRKEVRV